eukprot:3087616-Rhodomonas_salina.4
MEQIKAEWEERENKRLHLGMDGTVEPPPSKKKKKLLLQPPSRAIELCTSCTCAVISGPEKARGASRRWRKRPRRLCAKPQSSKSG